MKWSYILVILSICSIVLTISCTPIKQIPIVTVKTDSIFIKEVLRDTVIITKTEREYLQTETRDTTSVLSTEIAHSTASIKNNRLYHTLEQKSKEIPIKIQYVDRVVEKVVTKTEEIPIETPVPIRDSLFWYSIIANIVLGGLLILRILKALKIL